MLKGHKIILFGAGESGLLTKRALDCVANLKYNIIAFIDESPNLHGTSIENIPVYDIAKLPELLNSNDITNVILSIQNLLAIKKQYIVDVCLPYNIKVLSVPLFTNWINGELSFKQIKKIQIEDLLERDPIQLNDENIKKQLSGKVILVTGSAGSIGSELIRQIIKFNPKKIILFDQSESPLYDMDVSLSSNTVDHEPVIGDIRNVDRLNTIFEKYKPQIVFHAAAYKHVPLMESNVYEAVLTNVIGTKNVADLSLRHNVEKFVMISTDKAVNPANIMGATKRIAELYIQLNKETSTKFIITRFGNVLGSNGSVVPLFKKQIESGGPVTVTHPEITRFFMTIPEACQLVLEAGSIGNGGEVFMFDMGKPVKILDLAKKMIKLSGLILDKDIHITYTGLRSGEKLFEEVLMDSENTIPTDNKQIVIAKIQEIESSFINDFLILRDSLETQNDLLIVKSMKKIVPEFISNNSIYEGLDKK